MPTYSSIIRPKSPPHALPLLCKAFIQLPPTWIWFPPSLLYYMSNSTSCPRDIFPSFFFFQFSNIHHFYFYFCFLTKSNLGVILCIETFLFLGHKPNKEAKSRSVGGLVYATVALNQTISSGELGHDKMVSKSNL